MSPELINLIAMGLTSVLTAVVALVGRHSAPGGGRYLTPVQPADEVARDDALAALTPADRLWLRAHGWQETSR